MDHNSFTARQEAFIRLVDSIIGNGFAIRTEMEQNPTFKKQDFAVNYEVKTFEQLSYLIMLVASTPANWQINHYTASELLVTINYFDAEANLLASFHCHDKEANQTLFGYMSAIYPDVFKTLKRVAEQA